MSTMIVNRIYKLTALTLLVIFLSSCGGGSSGTSLGSGDNLRLFSGVVVSKGGNEVSFAKITLLDTDTTVTTDEAGAFEISSQLVSENASFSIESQNGADATVTIENLPEENSKVEFSIEYDPNLSSAKELDLVLNARIVKNCTPLFINTKTIRQKSQITEGLVCTIEAEIKKNGLPLDNLTFELQHRSCAIDADWEFTAISTTGSSGPGRGDIDFNFKNDEKHCVYRIRGPLNSSEYDPLNVHLHTLRKIAFDKK